MARLAKYAPVALVAGLLVATALAFVYTEKLKLTLSPIFDTKVEKLVSPVCDCRTGTATISFRLRKADRMSVDVIDENGNAVRTLVRNEPTPRGRTTLHWDGRAQNGEAVPEGDYEPRVHLVGQHRTIVMPNPMRVDVTPPHIQLVSLGPRVFSPDGDSRKERIIARFVIDEPSNALLFVNGVRRALKRGQLEKGRIEWSGKVDGKSPPPGVYRISLGSRDTAGNLGPHTPEKKVLIRYVALGRDRIVTVAGARFAVLVLSDAARVQWKLGKRTGTARPGTLKLRVPLQPGRYTLTVTANGFSDDATVIVRPPKQ